DLCDPVARVSVNELFVTRSQAPGEIPERSWLNIATALERDFGECPIDCPEGWLGTEDAGVCSNEAPAADRAGRAPGSAAHNPVGVVGIELRKHSRKQPSRAPGGGPLVKIPYQNTPRNGTRVPAAGRQLELLPHRRLERREPVPRPKLVEKTDDH